MYEGQALAKESNETKVTLIKIVGHKPLHLHLHAMALGKERRLESRLDESLDKVSRSLTKTQGKVKNLGNR